MEHERPHTIARGPLWKAAGGRTFRGIASTTDEDEEGDRLPADIIDTSYMERRPGYVNWHHFRDPDNLIGHVTRVQVLKTLTDRLRLEHLTGVSIPPSATIYVEGQLSDTEKGRKVTELLKAGNRALGLSLDGSVLRNKDTRQPTKAIVRGVAITFAPANSKTFVELQKSLVQLNARKRTIERRKNVITHWEAIQLLGNKYPGLTMDQAARLAKAAFDGERRERNLITLPDAIPEERLEKTIDLVKADEVPLELRKALAGASVRAT